MLLSKNNREKEAKANLDMLQAHNKDDAKVLNNINVVLGSENRDQAEMRKNFDVIRQNNLQNTTSNYNEAIFEFKEVHFFINCKRE